MQFWNYIILMHFWCSFKWFWCTFDVVSKLHQNCIKSASCFLRIFNKILGRICRNVQKIWCTLDAVLMQFWNYIILMHFWCSFKGFWCTFDVVSKLHQNCIKSASCFLRIFSKILGRICRNVQKIWCTLDAVLMQFWNYIILMHFWCSFKGFWCIFDVVSKLNCIKTASKVHHVFWWFSGNFEEKYV